MDETRAPLDSDQSAKWQICTKNKWIKCLISLIRDQLSKSQTLKSDCSFYSATCDNLEKNLISDQYCSFLMKVRNILMETKEIWNSVQLFCKRKKKLQDFVTNPASRWQSQLSQSFRKSWQQLDSKRYFF